MLLEHEEHKKNIKVLKLLEQKEFAFQKNLKLINELRKTILSNYCKNF